MSKRLAVASWLVIAVLVGCFPVAGVDATFPNVRPLAPRLSALGDDVPSPPEQPEFGPGGRDYRFGRVWSALADEGPQGSWLFGPAHAQGEPILGEAFPLVIFVHGYSATNPSSYLGWINHLVLRGAVVVYPIYQAETFADPDDGSTYLPNTETAIREAVTMLDGVSLPAIDLDRVAIVGHSAGGVIAANYAFRAAERDLPVPTALFFAMPGGCQGCGEIAERLQLPLDLDGDLPDGALAIVLVGDDDWVVGEGAARRIWEGLSVLPAHQRDYVYLHTDDRGSPPLRADHLQPQTGGLFGELNAYDWYGTWKLFDALMSCRFAGGDCASALGDTPQQRYLGEWSDGTPVRPLTITDDPK